MTPYYEGGGVTLYHADCLDVLPTLGPVDHVITDPPYDAQTHAGARTGTDGGVPIEMGFDPLDMPVFVPLLLSAAKRWCIAFCSLEMLGEYRQIAGPAWVRGGFWRKPDGAPQFTGDRPGQPGEALAICHRPGKKRWNGGGRHAFYEFGVERFCRAHPTQKPEQLMNALVADFSDEGETILDPFAGSGTTLVVARRLGRRAIGIEREERYCEVIAQRLAQGALWEVSA